MVRRFRKETGDDDTPILLMGYYNLVYQRGVETFCKEAAAAGVDGFILVDLPPEEADELKPHAAAERPRHGAADRADDRRQAPAGGAEIFRGLRLFRLGARHHRHQVGDRGRGARACRAHQAPHQAAGRRRLRHQDAGAGGRGGAPCRCRRRRHGDRRSREGRASTTTASRSPISCRASSPSSSRLQKACAACAKPDRSSPCNAAGHFAARSFSYCDHSRDRAFRHCRVTIARLICASSQRRGE